MHNFYSTITLIILIIIPVMLYLNSFYFLSDCKDAVARKNKQGIYSIQPGDSLGPFLAYCDEEGWTIIQRRFDGSENFYRYTETTQILCNCGFRILLDVSQVYTF
jgi:hypothetical protein